MFSLHFPQYFTKKVREEIGELYAHSAIANTALSMMAIFEPIFLYAGLGFTINQILFFTIIIYGTYIVFLPLGGKVASQYGYKHSIAISVPFQILYWMMLVASQQNHNLAFYAAPLYGLSKTFYWPGFHSLMARYSDRGQVGREFGLVYSLISLTLIAGPLLAGFLSQRFGFTIMFIVTAAIYSFSIFPLFRAKEIFLPKIYKFKDTLEIYKSFPNKFFGYLGFGEEVLVMNVWPVFIFLIVKNYEGAGSLATISSLIAAILALIVGKITDQYGKRVLIKIGAFFTAIIWLGRMIATNFWNTFFIDALSRTAKELAFIPISTVTYIRAENTHVVPYIIFFEQSLAIGKLLACLAGMIVFTIFSGLFGLGIGFVALFILGALFSLLYMLI